MGRTTKASDTFSFGVLMCEVCGDGKDLALSYAYKLTHVFSAALILKGSIKQGRHHMEVPLSDEHKLTLLCMQVISKVPPWTKKGEDFLTNADFPHFLPGTPEQYIQLAQR